MCASGSIICCRISKMEGSVDKKKNPHDLLTDEIVAKVFKADKGENAVFSSYQIIDFTNKGDNYASVVTSVTCQGTCDGRDVVGKYVVKINPCRSLSSCESFLTSMFLREGNFYLELLPKFKALLQPLGISLDCFPECLFAAYEKGQELLFTKDLRGRGFKMSDRIKGMGDCETVLALAALAKYHATYYIFQCKSKSSLAEISPILTESLFSNTDESMELFKMMIENGIDQGIEMLKNFEDRCAAIDWLTESKKDITKSFFDFFSNQEKKFECLLHGDCWNNNMLFRYDDFASSKPVEVILLDLQLCRLGSVAMDINYFFYSSLKGSDRQSNLTRYLELYFSEFSKMVSVTEFEMPFNLQELKEEQRRLVPYGALQGLMVVPMVLSEGEEVVDVDTINDENFEESMKDWKKKNVKMINKPSFKERFLSIFDDLEFHGFINSQENKLKS